MDLSKLTEQDIMKMSYNELIGLVRETNRIPGGAQTVAYIASMCCLHEGKRVLDIGTSTGNTAIDIASLSGAEVVGIDINEDSLSEARKRAKIVGVDSKTTFELNDAMNLSLPDKFFDMVICGNVTSLLSDKEKALSEYQRVLRDTGFLVAVPMYYIKKPSDQLIKDVSNAIQVNIKPLYKDFWIDFFTKGDFEIIITAKENINYEITFESKNSKPSNLQFYILENNRRYNTLEELNDILKGNILENEEKRLLKVRICSVSQVVKTLAFHAGGTGSTPVPSTINQKERKIIYE